MAKKNYKGNKKLISLFLIFSVILFIILLFTLVDYFIHLLSEEYSIPPYYFRNKIIFGTIIGLIIHFFIKKQKPLVKSLIFSAMISILLQIRYFLEGYSRTFVFEFLFFHFLILLPISFIVFILLKILELKFRAYQNS